MIDAKEIPSLSDLISLQAFEKATNEWTRNRSSGYRLLNPKPLDTQRLKKRAIREELDRKEK